MDPFNPHTSGYWAHKPKPHKDTIGKIRKVAFFLFLTAACVFVAATIRVAFEKAAYDVSNPRILAHYCKDGC